MSTELRRFRWTDLPVLAIAGLAAVLALLVVIYAVATPRPGSEVGDRASSFSGLARGIEDVALIDSSGAPIRWADLNDRPRLVFFGFTRCPEICPTTIAEMSAAIEAIGPVARSIEVDFVSVDPARDTPEHLAQYMQSFGPQFRGLTGEKAEIDRLVRAFHASYEFVPTEGDDYTVSHTAITYLVNSHGRVVDIIGYGTPHVRTVVQLRNFLGAGSS